MTRQRLPNRRTSETFAFECKGLPYFATISRFGDGRLGEIFLASHKAGSAADWRRFWRWVNRAETPS